MPVDVDADSNKAPLGTSLLLHSQGKIFNPTCGKTVLYFLKCVGEWQFKNTNWGGLSPGCYSGSVHFSRQIAVLVSHSHLAGRCLGPYRISLITWMLTGTLYFSNSLKCIQTCIINENMINIAKICLISFEGFFLRGSSVCVLCVFLTEQQWAVHSNWSF